VLERLVPPRGRRPGASSHHRAGSALIRRKDSPRLTSILPTAQVPRGLPPRRRDHAAERGWLSMLMIDKGDFARRHTPASLADRIAAGIVRLMEGAARLFFGRRYGDGAVVLETVAAVPAMVAATLLHLKCLRRMMDDRGWVRAFMDEAENQRAHLMAFVALEQPGPGERLFIAVAQALFYNAFFL